MGREKQDFDFSILLKINKAQKEKAKELRNKGINISQLLRNTIEDMHKKIVGDDLQRM